MNKKDAETKTEKPGRWSGFGKPGVGRGEELAQ